MVRVLHTLVTAVACIIQPRVQIHRLAVGEVGTEKQPVFKPLAQGHNAGVVVRIRIEQEFLMLLKFEFGLAKQSEVEVVEQPGVVNEPYCEYV